MATATTTTGQTIATTLVKKSVAAYIEAEGESKRILEKGLWGIVATAQRCRFVHHLSEYEVKQMYREEFERRFLIHEATSRRHTANKAIRIAFTRSEAEIANSRKNKGFTTIYSECARKRRTQPISIQQTLNREFHENFENFKLEVDNTLKELFQRYGEHHTRQSLANYLIEKTKYYGDENNN